LPLLRIGGELFVWLTLFGASIAFRTGSHLGFTLLFQKIANSIEANSDLVFLCLERNPFYHLIYYSIKQVHYEMTFNIRSMGVGIPQWYYTIGMRSGARWSF